MDEWKSKQDEYVLKGTRPAGRVPFLEIFGPCPFCMKEMLWKNEEINTNNLQYFSRALDKELWHSKTISFLLDPVLWVPTRVIILPQNQCFRRYTGISLSVRVSVFLFVGPYVCLCVSVCAKC